MSQRAAWREGSSRNRAGSAVPGGGLMTCKWHAGVSGLRGSGGRSEGELPEK